MDHQDIAAFKELPAHNICKGNLPIREYRKSRTYEVELLLNPSLSTFQICAIRGTYKNQLDWEVIGTLGGWLYSPQQSIIAITSCPSQTKKQIKLKGTGII